MCIVRLVCWQLGVKRFMTLGMFQDPTGGWPNWDDVDFWVSGTANGAGVAAQSRAVGEHWDYSLQDIDASESPLVSGELCGNVV